MQYTPHVQITAITELSAVTPVRKWETHFELRQGRHEVVEVARRGRRRSTLLRTDVNGRHVVGSVDGHLLVVVHSSRIFGTDMARKTTTETECVVRAAGGRKRECVRASVTLAEERLASQGHREAAKRCARSKWTCWALSPARCSLKANNS